MSRCTSRARQTRDCRAANLDAWSARTGAGTVDGRQGDRIQYEAPDYLFAMNRATNCFTRVRLRNEGGGSIGIFHHLLLLCTEIDWHDHRIGTQNDVIRQDELRAVLQVQQNPIAFLDTAYLLPEASDQQRLRVEDAEADRGI